jgi:hypothetical protein
MASSSGSVGIAAEGALTRRLLIKRGLAGAGALVTGGLWAAGRAGAAALPPWPSGLPAGVVGSQRLDASLLPSPRALYRDVKRMVDFGQRYPGSDAHGRFVDWLEDGLRSCGLEMLPRDHIQFTRWLAESWSLEIVSGPSRGPVPVAGWSPYSGQTPPTGVTAPLVYMGPTPSTGLPGNPQDIYSLRASIKRVRSELADWAKAAIAGISGGIAGKIVLVDVPLAPLQEDDFAPLLTYWLDGDPAGTKEWPGRTIFALQPPLSIFAQHGAVGVVSILDASPANAAGQGTAYGQPMALVPGLIVDREVGAKLRRQAQSTPAARLTLTASVGPGSVSQLVGILPGDGSTDEVMILNTHTDGMNAFEENGGVMLVHLARYFASLPRGRRLKRSLVFSCVAGHFAGPSLPQTLSFIDFHPDLVARAAASLTIEHFGCSEWSDDAHGYHPTGRNEFYVTWHSQTPMVGPLIDAIKAHDLKNTAALRPAGDYMIGVGTPLHEVGVPTVSAIAGPAYLVSWADNGHLDKFRAPLAAAQLAWAADLITRYDEMPASQLAIGDSTVLRTGIACQSQSLPSCSH